MLRDRVIDMTPEQCRELAEFHEHMAREYDKRSALQTTGLIAAVMRGNAEVERESARYWREKAGE